MPWVSAFDVRLSASAWSVQLTGIERLSGCESSEFFWEIAYDPVSPGRFEELSLNRISDPGVWAGFLGPVIEHSVSKQA